MKTMKATNEYGILFIVELTDERSSKFGNIVKFYDTRQSKSFGDYGQMVSSYYSSTLLEGEDGYGLNLDAGIDGWHIDSISMNEVRQWLREEI